MTAREGMEFETGIQSDSASVYEPVAAMLAAGINVHRLRDATRGGVVSALVGIAQAAHGHIAIDESVVQ